MTKSKMRIYKGRGYSNHEVDLFMNIDENDVAYLNIVTPHEVVTLPVHDILEAITDD